MRRFKPISVFLVMALAVSPLLISCQHHQRTVEATPQSTLGTDIQKAEVQGIKNYSRVGMGTGFGGATEPSSMAWLKSEGFASVINLRFASEDGVELEASQAAAKAEGMQYIHLPLNPGKLDQQFMDDFLAAMENEVNQPVYMHCGSATRAAAVWMIKRVIVDGWSPEKAGEEAKSIAGKPEAAIGLATRYIESTE